MTSDEERREVARRLRGPFDVIGQGRYVSLNGTLFGMQLLANSENELRAGVRRLAALIDPGSERTCRNVYKENRHEMYWCDNGFECSECGDVVEDFDHYKVTGTFNFCPKCGARVVSE